MTDTERDPTRTEDVEEALEALEQLRGMVREDAELLGDPDGYEGTICDVLCALRSRLEEAQKTAEIRREEREEMWGAANENLREARAARRRADRLEDENERLRQILRHLAGTIDGMVMQEVRRKLDFDWYVNRMEDARDDAWELLSALDSREDEGEDPNLYPQIDDHALSEEEIRERMRSKPYGAVHADEPEGDEYEVDPHDILGPLDALLTYAKADNSSLDDERAKEYADRLRRAVYPPPTDALDSNSQLATNRDRSGSSPTDEPVSGEGDPDEWEHEHLSREDGASMEPARYSFCEEPYTIRLSDRHEDEGDESE